MQQVTHLAAQWALQSGILGEDDKRLESLHFRPGTSPSPRSEKRVNRFNSESASTTHVQPACRGCFQGQGLSPCTEYENSSSHLFLFHPPPTSKKESDICLLPVPSFLSPTHPPPTLSLSVPSLSFLLSCSHSSALPPTLSLSHTHTPVNHRTTPTGVPHECCHYGLPQCVSVFYRP